MQRRRDYGRGSNDFGRNAESIFREHLQDDPRFGGGWAHDWDSNPNRDNGSYRGGPRRMHWSDDRDYSPREGHGLYADDDGGTVYDSGNRGRGDYGHGSSYARRGYYNRGSYYEDAGRYSPRFHERREYDERPRREYDEYSASNDRRPYADRSRYRFEEQAERPRDRDERPRDRDERPRDRDERPRDRDERPRDRDERPRDRNGYDPRDIGSNDRRDRWSSYGRDEDSRFGADHSDDIGHEHWYRGEISRDPRHRRDRDRFSPPDSGGQYGGRNTW